MLQNEIDWLKEQFTEEREKNKQQNAELMSLLEKLTARSGEENFRSGERGEHAQLTEEREKSKQQYAELVCLLKE